MNLENRESSCVLRRSYSALVRSMVAALLIVVLLPASNPLKATSVVALLDRSKNRLVVATDCLVNRPFQLCEEVQNYRHPWLFCGDGRALRRTSYRFSFVRSNSR
jgi:hypothetical protein